MGFDWKIRFYRPTGMIAGVMKVYIEPEHRVQAMAARMCAVMPSATRYEVVLLSAPDVEEGSESWSS